MRHLMAVAGLAVLAVPAMAVAQPMSSGPSYSYLEAGYVDADGAGGFGLGASLEITPAFHAAFGFSHVEDGGLDVNVTTLAGGFSHPVSGTTDFVARAGLARASVDTAFGDASENGFMAQVGVRSMVSSSTELHGSLTYTDTFSGETSVGIVHFFNDRAGVSAALEANDGDFGFFAGLRFGF